MIKLILGNVGSGKTASVVRFIREHKEKTVITNIDVRGKDFKHVIKLKPEMIIKREVSGFKKSGEEIYSMSLNVEYWKELISKHKGINVIIDEAHIFFNPRRSMSKINLIMNDFLALLRRVLGSSDGTSGELILITQLSRRLDIIAKEMATNVQYCVHHYRGYCEKCGMSWNESNETSDKIVNCPRCNSWKINKRGSIIETWCFRNTTDYSRFEEYNEKSYYKHFIIKDIHTIFGNYNTLQWDDLLSEY